MSLGQSSKPFVTSSLRLRPCFRSTGFVTDPAEIGLFCVGISAVGGKNAVFCGFDRVRADNLTMSKQLLTLACVLASLALAAPQAMAQGSTTRGYDESGGVIGELPPDSGGATAQPPLQPTSRLGSPQAPADESVSNGALPFTGLDVGILALMGLALLGTGFTLRRRTSNG
jgi:hypothetical protein